MQNKQNAAVAMKEMLRLFNQLDAESKIAFKNKLESRVEKRFSRALNTLWKKNKGKDARRVASDVREVVRAVRAK